MGNSLEREKEETRDAFMDLIETTNRHVIETQKQYTKAIQVVTSELQRSRGKSTPVFEIRKRTALSALRQYREAETERLRAVEMKSQWAAGQTQVDLDTLRAKITRLEHRQLVRLDRQMGRVDTKEKEVHDLQMQHLQKRAQREQQEFTRQMQKEAQQEQMDYLRSTMLADAQSDESDLDRLVQDVSRRSGYDSRSVEELMRAPSGPSQMQDLPLLQEALPAWQEASRG